MEDLISREAAIDAVKRAAYWNDAERKITELPAVDAVPVAHAKLIKYEPDMHGVEPLECSACNYLFARLYPQNYCPNCGAKIDKEEDKHEDREASNE